MSQSVNVSAGAAEYTWPTTITETTGKVITADTVLVSLGTYDAPGTWVTPAVLTRPTTSTVVVQLLINASTPLGNWWVWAKVTDTPETVPRRGAKITVR